MKNARKVLKALAALALIVLSLPGFANIAAAASAPQANMTQAQKNFVDKVSTMAADDMKQSGILASVTVAQAILESAWGTSALAEKANALFGIKADARWNGRVFSKTTLECYDGLNFVTENAVFRAYDSWQHSISDHSAFLLASSRYAAVIGERSYKKACAALQKAGYATDPGYADKLIKIIDTYGLTAFDNTDACKIAFSLKALVLSVLKA